MTGRIATLTSLIEKADILADVGCDHGYITKALVDAKKVGKVIMTDVSKKCLSKAERLMQKEIESGIVKAVVCDGLTDVFEPVDTVVVAGMGGEEIVKILSESVSRLPIKTLLLQPMKNSEKVREFCVRGGFSPIRDYTFYDQNKYYDVILAVKTDEKISPYSEDELTFGRENLAALSTDFLKKASKDIADLTEWASRTDLSKENKDKLVKKIEKIKKLTGIL